MRDLKELYNRFLRQECTPEEVNLLLDQFRLKNNEDLLRGLIKEELEKEAPAPPDAPGVSAILERNQRRLAEIIKQDTVPYIHRGRRSFVWYAAASVIAGLCLFLGYYFYAGNDGASPAELVQEIHDADPGGNRATLTLSDGSTIVLDDAGQGQLAEQGGVILLKTGEGQLNYKEAKAPAKASQAAYNTIRTPRGGTFRVVLPDGTKVWLNSASELRYPVSFDADKRTVELSGEGYFEVSHRKGRPFVVKSPGQEVEVLGTHFNIKAYDNEPWSRTTLVEGSVNIRQLQTGKEQLLQPGEQARLNSNGRLFEVSPASVEESVAWKNELFIFRNTDIRSVMNQLERWYDVELDVTDLPEKRFYGEMSRDVQLSEILKMIEVTSGLKFKVEGRKIMLQ